MSRENKGKLQHRHAKWLDPETSVDLPGSSLVRGVNCVRAVPEDCR